MDHKSFFVNISSTDSLTYFPYNNSHKFSNVLSSPIDLSDVIYEVALASLMYQQIDVPSTQRSLNLPDQSRIVVNYPSKSVFTKTLGLADWYLGVNQVIDSLNDEFKKLHYAHLEVFLDEEKNYIVKLYVYVPFDGKILLDGNLSLLLGLSTTTFSNGKHVGESKVDIDMLRTPRNSFEFSITLIKFVNLFVTIPKPQDESLDSLAEAINLAFETKSLDIVAVVDQNEEFFNFAFPDDLISIYLPIELSHYFGSNPEQKYSITNRQIE